MSALADTTGFTVTCPSNSNMATYPKNVGSNYRVKLAKPLTLAGQSLNENAQWQVAMLSVHYTHNFYNFRKPCTLRFVMAVPSHGVDTGETPDRNCSVIALPVTEANLSEEDQALLRTYLLREDAVVRPAELEITLREVLYGKLLLPARHYASVSDTWLDIVRQFDKMFYPRYKLRLQVTLSKSGTIAFALSNGKAVKIFADSPYIGGVLGLPTKPLKTVITEEAPQRGVTIHGMLGQPTKAQKTVVVEEAPTRELTFHDIGVTGMQTPKLDGVQALYIYSDIVDQQFVGDTMAPLLAYVDVTKSPGERIGHVCNPPMYLSVNRSFIESVGIRICDEHGQNVDFPDDVENVVVRLHFRKCKHSTLF